jgi:hypothetical protein
MKYKIGAWIQLRRIPNNKTFWWMSGRVGRIDGMNFGWYVVWFGAVEQWLRVSEKEILGEVKVT